MDLQRVAAHPFLTGIPESELEQVALAASEREFASGEVLMSEGDFGHSLFLVESGSADVSVDGVKVAEAGPGAVVGEVAVLASGRRTASVVATSPVRVMAFFKRDVWTLERSAPESARRLRAAIADHTSGDSGHSSGD